MPNPLLVLAIGAAIAVVCVALPFLARARRGKGRREAARIRSIWDKKRRDEAMHFE